MPDIKERLEQERILLNALMRHDKEAFSLLYDNYSSAIFGVILKIIHDYEIAEEVLQDVYVKIWEKITTYNSEKGRLYTWMYNIARNLAIDKVRSREYVQLTVTDSLENSLYEAPSGENYFASSEILAQDLLQYLSPAQSLVLNLMYFKGYTSEDVANEYKIPHGTVKSRVRAALKKLRDIYGVADR